VNAVIKAMRFNMSVLTRSGYLPVSLGLLVVYSLLSYSMGVNTSYHLARYGASTGEIIAMTDDMIRLACSGSLILVPIVLYLLPLINIRDGKIENMPAATLPLSLPVSRREYAYSRFLYAGGSSVVLVILFTGLNAAGVWYRPESFRTEAYVTVRIWFALISVMIHVAGMLLVAASLGAKNFLNLAAAIFLVSVILTWLISSEIIYKIATSPFFWPVAAVSIIAADIISIVSGTFIFERRDI